MAKWTKSDIELSNGVKFTIIHNIPIKSIMKNANIGNLQSAIDNWCARTKHFTEESFVDYINSKGTHMAFTQKQYEEASK